MALYDDIVTPDDYGTSIGNEELTMQAQRLARRKAQLEADARAAANQTGRFASAAAPTVQGGWTSAVTGTPMVGQVAKQSPFAQLAPLVADEMHGLAQRRYDKDFSGYQRLEAAAAKRLMDEMPRAGMRPGPYGVDVPYTPTQQEVVAWANRAREIPSLRTIADQLMADQLIKEPEREEARAERKLTREEARAEAQRKQADELAYRRERDQEANQLRRDIAQQNADLRREMAAATRAAAASGDAANKASNWRQETAADGSISYFNVVTGDRKGGGQGKPTATFEKDQQDTRNAIEQSNTIIGEERRVQELLGKASSTGLKATLGQKANYFTGYESDALKADAALRPIAARYVQAVPKFSGPTSDADVKEYKQAAADLANTELSPPLRAQAHREVVRLQKKALAQQKARGTFAGDSASRRQDNNAQLNTGPKPTVSWGDLK